MSASFGCTLIVAAASDLMPLEKRLVLPGCRVRYTFGSSGMLAQQIRHGAEFDLYLSANEHYVDELIRAGGAHASSKVVYAQGRIGLWSAKNLALSDLPSLRALAMANPAHAPYGQAAKEALEQQGLWSRVANRMVFGENVRQALRFAETGNADAAIVAWSLVKDKGGQLLPAEWHKPILQTAAIPVRSRNREAAQKLLTFLLSPAGQRVLAQSGFFPAPTAPQSRSASPVQ